MSQVKKFVCPNCNTFLVALELPDAPKLSDADWSMRASTYACTYCIDVLNQVSQGKDAGIGQVAKLSVAPDNTTFIAVNNVGIKAGDPIDKIIASVSCVPDSSVIKVAEANINGS